MGFNSAFKGLKTVRNQTLRFVDHGSQYNFVNKANLVHIYCLYIYQSLHVLGDYAPIISRNNCIYVTLGTCYSAWMTGMQGRHCIPDSHPHRITNTKCCINAVVSPDDGRIAALNMKRWINL